MILQPRRHVCSLGHAQLGKITKRPPRSARCGRFALVGVEQAQAGERPGLPGAEADVVESRQAVLQAAGRLLEASLLAAEVTKGAEGVRLGAAVAGGACEREALPQAVGGILKAASPAVDLAEL